MCGIAGIIYHHRKRYKNLGADLRTLIEPLESRGPDSCGVGLYGNRIARDQVKLRMSTPASVSWKDVSQWLAHFGRVIQLETTGTEAGTVLEWHGQWHGQQDLHEELKAELGAHQVHLISLGVQLEIYKEVGSVADLFGKNNLAQFGGSHAIGHTRMATESVVDTAHSHPFTAAADLALVHNGQVSNYYKLRFALERQGVVFETDNDSEAIAHYIHQQLRQGKSLETVLHQLLADIDGTYTLLVATADQVGLVRDKFAAKPAVIYESPECVAIASEFRCLINLPDYPAATIREPDAGEVNVWSTAPERVPEIALSQV